MKDSALWHRRAFIKNMGYSLFALAIPFSLTANNNLYKMKYKKIYDIIIVGGSYSGLAAAMTLGRALKKVLVIDSGMPCNRQTPFSHNFLTNDGKTPSQIRATAYEQVRIYPSIEFFEGLAIKGTESGLGFAITVDSGETFEAGKVIFATGISDMLPEVEGLSECWGISVIHCPYCHGYEYKHEKTGILGNADKAFETAMLISNWTNDLSIFTNGTASFTPEQRDRLNKHGVNVIEKQVHKLEHTGGHLSRIIFTDGSGYSLKALYAPPPFEQHCKIPMELGCEMTEDGYIKTDSSFETTKKGLYAIGDNASKMRTVANAVAMGTAAGMLISKKMIVDAF
ncbi:MAG: NAD(P)/FAD-dependent oxidoreductase [Bacteroidetes bacterium]|nr:NAD(P)/FAD-dependent oxidoreductase [Bacteroidota bacterium]